MNALMFIVYCHDVTSCNVLLVDTVFLLSTVSFETIMIANAVFAPTAFGINGVAENDTEKEVSIKFTASVL